ncbi:Nucleoporin p58/p45 [Chytriomyces hyalinus]|nr:Nucleoporin p58/p45 [Chytriomyces hyalinus]
MFSFGTPAAAPAAATGQVESSLFNTANTANTQNSNSLFGAATTNSNAAPSLNTGNLFGGAGASINSAVTAQNTAANAQTANPQPSTTAPENITNTTRYGEIPLNIRQELDNFETFVQKQIDMSEDIASSGVVKKIHDTRALYKSVELKYQGLKTLLDRDNALIQNLRGQVAREMKIADFATRFIDSYNSHRQPSVTFNNTDSFQYFVNLTNTLENKLQHYRQTIDDLERHLQSISQKTQYSPQAIAEILKLQHESFLAIAGRIAVAHDSLLKQQDAYLNYRRKYFGDTKNPFRKGFVGQDEENLTSLSTIASSLKPDSGNAAPAQAAPAASTGFGGFGTSIAAQPAASGFGGFGASTTQPASTGLSFVNSTAAQPAASGFGGFGASTAGQQPAAAANTGFGGFGTPAAQPAATGGFGGFGTPAAAQPAAATTGFGGFGAAAQQPAAATGGFGGFGTPAAQPAAGAAGGFGGFGAATPAAGAFGAFGSPSISTRKKR